MRTDFKIKAKNPPLILLTSSADFVVCLILRVLCTLRNLMQVMNNVEQTVVQFCWLPHAAVVHLILQKRVI